MFLKQVLNEECQSLLSKSDSIRHRSAEGSVLSRRSATHRIVFLFKPQRSRTLLTDKDSRWTQHELTLTESRTNHLSDHWGINTPHLFDISLLLHTSQLLSFVFYSHFLSYILSHLLHHLFFFFFFFSSSITSSLLSLLLPLPVSLTSFHSQLTVLAESSPEK